MLNAIADNWLTLLALGVCWVAWWRARRAETRLGELAEAVASLLRRDRHGRTLLSRIEAFFAGIDMGDMVREATDEEGYPGKCRKPIVPLGKARPDGFDGSAPN